jgi:hypothetical protein
MRTGPPVMSEATETAMSRRLNWERANLNKKAKGRQWRECTFVALTAADSAVLWVTDQ